MRIISGSRRGRKLLSFEGDAIRPTTDRVKEAMFNLIRDYLSGSSVLDLFGGTGALSLEALSQGAKEAVIVDSSKGSVDLIKKNIELVGFLNEAKVVNTKAEDYLKHSQESFDVIFLDPPYNKGFIKPVLCSITEGEILKSDGIVVLESDFSDDHGEVSGLNIIKARKYGRTYITVYQKS